MRELSQMIPEALYWLRGKFCTHPLHKMWKDRLETTHYVLWCRNCGTYLRTDRLRLYSQRLSLLQWDFRLS